MKKIMVLVVLVALATTCFSQQDVSKNYSLSREDYLKKAKNKKRIGWILLGSGAVLIATSAIIPEGEYEGLDACIYLVCEKHKNDGIKAGFGLTGAASMLASVPFFVSSGKNKRKGNALAASVKMENASIVRGYHQIKLKYPALSLKLHLN